MTLEKATSSGSSIISIRKRVLKKTLFFVKIQKKVGEENMNLYEIIDKEIKLLWKEDVSADYDACRLLKEDCLKNCFYYHLRRRLGDEFLDENNLEVI